jgi:MOSC domain-containing protein YiiM
MKIVSINVGVPRTVLWHDREVITGIFKEPVTGPVMLRRLNLDGDRQADLENHGGSNKAVYAYPAEHYDLWREELKGVELGWGAFGENFTVEGLKEELTYIGDEFRFGPALLRVTQPRIPCYKLGLRLQRDDIVKRFLLSNRSGVYFSVLEQGFVNTGDAVTRIKEDEQRISVLDINHAIADSQGNIPVMQRAVGHPGLPSGMREHFLTQLASIQSR